ncbi:MAG: YbaB/EbfC family nucleoid-associated protein [Candidatus Woesearchaeota archaeon]
MKGFSGGKMGELMKQAQKMQEDLKKAQEELENKEFKSSVANGMVEITANGKKKIKSVKLKKQAVDPDDVEMLEDLLVTAFNDINDKIDNYSKEKMGKSGMPEGMGNLF